MARMLWIATLSVALASTADAVKAAAAHPLESLAVTASNLGQKALDDPACFALVESLTTEIGRVWPALRPIRGRWHGPRPS
jgi:hypothetical protein